MAMFALQHILIEFITLTIPTLMEYAHAILANVPAPDAYNTETGERIVAATNIAAQQHQVEIKCLPG